MAFITINSSTGKGVRSGPITIPAVNTYLSSGYSVYHLRGLGCSRIAGCVAEAKSHSCIEERTSDVVISAFFRRTGG